MIIYNRDMKKRKNMIAKIVAFIALFSIVIWFIGTGLLVVFSPWNETEVSQEELQEYIDSLSWATISWSWKNIDVSNLDWVSQ